MAQPNAKPAGKRAVPDDDDESRHDDDDDDDVDNSRPALSDADLLVFVDKTRERLRKNVPTKIRTDWALKDDAAEDGTYAESKRQTWTGVAAMRRSGKLEIVWEDDTRNVFPHPQVAYISLDFVGGGVMPGVVEDEDENPYVFHDPRTWGEYIDGDVDLAVFEMRLRSDFRIPHGSGGKIHNAFSGLLLWVRAAREINGWNEGATLELGKYHVRLVRDAIAEADGFSVSEIHARLYGTDHPDDKYGLALAQLEKKKSKFDKRKTKRSVVCSFCNKDGHNEAQCWLRAPETAPKHLRDKIRAESKDFPKGGSGSLPLKTK